MVRFCGDREHTLGAAAASVPLSCLCRRDATVFADTRRGIFTSTVATVRGPPMWHRRSNAISAFQIKRAGSNQGQFAVGYQCLFGLADQLS